MSTQRDPLTGAPDRYTWDAELPAAVERTRRDGEPLTVAMIDLDHFQQFNDDHGYQAGDRFLKSVVAAWTGILRPTDLLCRYGGEEFALVLPGATTEQASAVLERMRTVTPLGQTFSSGVASWNGAETQDHLVRRSSAALEAAKRAGRARTVSADGPQPQR
ncbi:MAG: GGDEF domain-containing protein [Dactylosporangium sp.]|nr:GGDEF domain-containing protein [Dactylosporangium sp.]NNJ59841.1 GGDEF domain-containing protein [Dactylosporangium sp.]